VASVLAAAVAARREDRGPGSARHRIARSAARVRLLSGLLTLYCAMAGLGLLLEATAPSADPAGDEDGLAVSGLALDLSGVWVGGAGLRAAQRADLASVTQFDRSLRVLAAFSLAYEAYIGLVVAPSRVSSDDGAAPPRDRPRRPPGVNETLAPTYGPQTVERGISRESQVLAGVVSVILWAAIWMVCLNNAARLRLDVAANPTVAALAVAPSLEAQDDIYVL